MYVTDISQKMFVDQLFHYLALDKDKGAINKSQKHVSSFGTLWNVFFLNGKQDRSL